MTRSIPPQTPAPGALLAAYQPPFRRSRLMAGTKFARSRQGFADTALTTARARPIETAPSTGIRFPSPVWL
jgi:hypothetical protein